MDNDKLYNSLVKYYNAHQISKTKNLINIYLSEQDFPSGNANYPKCIWRYFRINEVPWTKQVVNASNQQDACFFVKKAIFENFGDIAKDLSGNCDCEKCFNFCTNRYFRKSGGISLAIKKRKS